MLKASSQCWCSRIVQKTSADMVQHSQSCHGLYTWSFIESLARHVLRVPFGGLAFSSSGPAADQMAIQTLRAVAIPGRS